MSEQAAASNAASSAAGAETSVMRDRVPLWLAVSITVVVSLPFGLWLGDYNLALWVSFIVWAEYFVLGGKPAALKIIIPAFLIGVFGAMWITTGTALLEEILGGAGVIAENDVAAFTGMFAGFCVFLYAVRWVRFRTPTTTDAT